jgi:hypothetical protein
MRINDAHCHFFSRRFFEALGRQVGTFPEGDLAAAVARTLDWEAPGEAPDLADRWCTELDRQGVTRAVLIASVPGDAGSVVAAVGRHPTRFVGFAMIDPTKPGALDAVRPACAAGTLRGLCLFPAMFHHRLDEEPARAVFELARAHPGTAVFVHCGVLSVGVRGRLGLASPFDLRLGQPLDLLPVAAEFADVPIVIPHFGAGFFREALMLADARPNVYVDTSSSNGWVKFHPGLTLSEVFARAIQIVGPERLLFGTDSSFFPRGWHRPVLDTQQQVFDVLGLDPGVRARILGDTFDRLFPL